ncbi:MAG: DUF423 domain-containing protein [Bacteroidetes bacterium]|nr:DUF423 domain-containing protein [Bacteroidota bacterium]HET6244305.1 DUF423 domain-containing protein [Bacteroidia bacterium]
MPKSTIIIAGISAAISVILGAMGAHALKDILHPDLLNSFETGVQYQFYHSLALIGVASLQFNYQSKFFSFASWSFIIGIILFSGSIYLLTLRELLNMPGLRILGPVTPFGGISLILGWIFLTLSGFEIKKK